MAYEKQTWNTGETITADKLNHIEDGIAEGGSGGGVFVVNFTYDEQTNKCTADKTLQEIETASLSGPVIGYIDFSEHSRSTYVLNNTMPLQFNGVYVTGNTGVISVLNAELDEETYEPTGLWTFTNYNFSVNTIPV